MHRQPFSILMADDDLEDLELLEAAIRDQHTNATFHKVTSGRAVLRLLKGLHEKDLPCLIVLDYNMPELTGAEVLVELAKSTRYQWVAKVILSTSNSPGYVKECRNLGAIDYLVKPTSLVGMREVVHKLMTYCERTGPSPGK